MSDTSLLHDVFISYSLHDRTWVREFLLPALRTAGLSAIDHNDFEIGVPELVNMERAVDQTPRTLIILTPAWLEDQSANFIALLAQTKGVASRVPKLLPLLLEPCALPERIAMLTKADFTDPERRPEELQRLVDTLRARGPETPAPASTTPFAGAANRIPSPVADFTGRQADVQTLADHLTAASVPIAGIRGMGGIGKTQLALAVAQRLRDIYPEQLIFELQPGPEPLAPAGLLGRVIHALQIKAKLSADLEELAAQYRSALIGRRGLILLDDAAAGQQVAPLLPPPPGWAVIVTSRARFPMDGARLHNVELLAIAEAVQLLGRMLAEGGRNDLDGADLKPLAERCGRLPLGLRLAAGYLTSTDRTLEKYVKDLKRARLKYLKDPEGERSVRAVLGLSVDRLSHGEGALPRRWHALAVFPAPFDVGAAADIWETGEDDAQDTLDALRRQSLVDYDRGMYSLHDLLRDMALEQPLADEVYYRHARHYLDVGGQANDLYQQGQAAAGLRTSDAALPHLRAAYLWMSQQPTPEARRWLNDLPIRTADAFNLRVTAAVRIQVLQTALEAARELGDRRAEASHLSNLGLAQVDLGEAQQAIGYFEQALRISQAIGDRKTEGARLSDLGNSYLALGEARKAIAYHQQALALQTEIGDRRREGATLGRLGLACAHLGDLPQAIGYYQQALDIARQTNDRTAEELHLANLGIAYRDLGDARQAIKYYARALNVSPDVDDKDAVRDRLGHMPVESSADAELQTVIGYYEQALKISQEIGDRRAEARQLGNLAWIYAALNEPQKAIRCYEQSLAIHLELGDRRGQGHDLANLGKSYAARGELRTAIEYYEEALAIRQEIGDRRGEAHDLADLAKACAAFGEPQSAIGHLEAAIAISREMGDRRGVAQRSWELGMLYATQGDFQRAGELMQPLVDYQREVGHPDAETHAETVADIRRRAAGGRPLGSVVN